MAEARFSDLNELTELSERVSSSKIAWLALLTLLASLTEGFGLFLLIPISQLVSSGESQEIPSFLADLIEFGAGPLLICLIGIVALRALVVFQSNELRRGIQLELSHAMRTETHQAIMQAEWSWLARQESSEHTALIIGESERSASLFGDVVTIFNAGMTFGILALAAAFVSPAIALIAALLALPMLFLLLTLNGGASKEAEAYWNAYSAIQGSVSNGIGKLRAARISGAQNLVATEFRNASKSLSDLERVYFRRGFITQTIIQISAVCALASLTYFALEVRQAPLALFAPVLILAIRAVPLVNQAHQAVRSWRYNKPAMARLRQFIEEATENRELLNPTGQALVFERAIELDEISLRYEGRELPVFDRFSLKIAKGKFIAITGPSGSGKSSLADLFSGLLLPDMGSIIIDDQPLSEPNRTCWRSQVGYLDQHPFFLTASVRDNLCWGRDGLQDPDLADALAQASAGFVWAWPDGLDTMMGEGGRQLSGGELRRLALARVLLRKPELLLLDEVTASLDADNSRAILDAVVGLRGDTTIVALTHDERVTACADEVHALGRC